MGGRGGFSRLYPGWTPQSNMMVLPLNLRRQHDLPTSLPPSRLGDFHQSSAQIHEQHRREESPECSNHETCPREGGGAGRSLHNMLLLHLLLLLLLPMQGPLMMDVGGGEMVFHKPKDGVRE